MQIVKVVGMCRILWKISHCICSPHLQNLLLCFCFVCEGRGFFCSMAFLLWCVLNTTICVLFRCQCVCCWADETEKQDLLRDEDCTRKSLVLSCELWYSDMDMSQIHGRGYNYALFKIQETNTAILSIIWGFITAFKFFVSSITFHQ